MKSALQEKLIALLEQTPATSALTQVLKHEVEMPESKHAEEKKQIEKQTLLYIAGVFSDPARRKNTLSHVQKFLSETGLQKTLDEMQPAPTSTYQPKKN